MLACMTMLGLPIVPVGAKNSEWGPIVKLFIIEIMTGEKYCI